MAAADHRDGPDDLPADERPAPAEAEEVDAPGTEADGDPLAWSAEPNEPA